MIVVKIDVTKIDKGKLFEGAKGTYLDVVLIDTPDDGYGNDYMAVQGVSKEERESGVKGAILGNGKVFGVSPAPPNAGNPQQQEQYPENQMEDDSIPF